MQIYVEGCAGSQQQARQQHSVFTNAAATDEQWTVAA
jgi:hypothetical protein